MIVFAKLVSGCRGLSQTYAVEAQAYVLHCTSVISDVGTKLMGTEGSPLMGHPIRGSSAVIGPDGRILTTAETENEKLIVADLDMSQVVKAKTFADASGHCKSLLWQGCQYNTDCGADSRPDMLWLGADPTTKAVVRVATIAP